MQRSDRTEPGFDFLKQNFDKLLMSSLFLITVGVLIHVVHHGSDAGTISWLENTVGQILAALLTLVVSKQLAQRSTDVTNTGPGSQTIVEAPGPTTGASNGEKAQP